MENTNIPAAFQPIVDLQQHLESLAHEKDLAHWYNASVRALYRSGNEALFSLIDPFLQAYKITTAQQLTIFQQLCQSPVTDLAGLHATFHLYAPVLADATLRKRIARSQDTAVSSILEWYLNHVGNEDNEHEKVYLLTQLQSLPVATEVWQALLLRTAYRYQHRNKQHAAILQFFHAMQLPLYERDTTGERHSYAAAVFKFLPEMFVSVPTTSPVATSRLE